MRILLALALFFGTAATVSAFGQAAEIQTQTRYYTGYGSQSGFCSGNDYFCIDNLQRWARKNATDDASWQCKMHNGQPDQFGAYCSDFCNPNYIPPGSSSTYVSCRSDCQVRCQIPDTNNEVVE